MNLDAGQWPHHHVRVSANGQVTDSAINLKSLTEVQIEYRRRQFMIQKPVFANVVALSDGLHQLARVSMSGALDYVRHGGITGTGDWISQVETTSSASSTLCWRASSGGCNIFGDPPITGTKTHDADGAYPPTGPVPTGPSSSP